MQVRSAEGLDGGGMDHGEPPRQTHYEKDGGEFWQE